MNTEHLREEPVLGVEPRESELSERIQLLRRSVGRNIVSILALTMLAGVVAAIFANSVTPTYRATATLYVEPTKSNVVSIPDLYATMPGDQEHLQTQVEILKSRSLAAKLVKRLDLTKRIAESSQLQAVNRRNSTWYRMLDAIGWRSDDPPVTEERIAAEAIDTVVGHLDVEPVRSSYLIRVAFESSDAKLAAAEANALAEVYIENDYEAHLQLTRQAASWLTARAKSLREDLAASETALQQFRDKERIIDSKGVALGAAAQLTSLSTNFVTAHQKVAEVENQYRQVQAALQGGSKEMLSTIPAVQHNPVVERAYAAEAEAERNLAELSRRYGADHPRIIAAESDLRSARDNRAKAIDAAAAAITREYEVSRATEETMRLSLDRTKSEIQEMSRKEFQLASLERDVQTNRELYEMFVNRYKETNIAGDLQSSVARVIDAADVPLTPIRPRKGLIVGLSLMSAFVLAIGIALLFEELDNTVRSIQDVDTRLGGRLLGIVPHTNSRQQSLARADNMERQEPGFSEAIRSLRTSLLMATGETPNTVVLVASTMSGEGKTTVAVNLALALAQLKRTCLIDGDMRRPAVGEALGGDSDAAGLSNLVTGTKPAASCVHRHSSGLTYVPAGSIPPNPLELLSSKRFADTVKRLSESFDIVVIDSPPIHLMSDAMVLASVAHLFVFVVRADTTASRTARRALERLSKGRARLLGIVLNALDLDRASRYYGYDR